MTAVKISELPVATTVSGSDVLPIVQASATKQASRDAFLTDATLTTPYLGTPQSGNLQNCTSLPIDAGTTGTLPATRGGTGLTSLGTGMATFLQTPSSANFAATLTDETGSGSVVFATSPTLVTPTIGAATATSINKVAITAPATSAAITIANLKTFVVNNALTLSGTDATTMTFPATSATIARTDAAQTFTGLQTFTTGVIGGVQALAGAGAVDVVTLSTAFTSTATGNAMTLADGAVGQIKTVAYVAEAAAGDTGILTPTNTAGAWTTITFNNVGDSVTLQFFTGGWAIIGAYGAVVA